uniref:Pentatricopeptide repeat-containing protein n=1 Tax=Oryza brachyantha TaxID=4533 RepID=J3N850_ORYBR
MYAALGDVSAARSAFASLPDRDVVAWTTLIGAYSNAGELGEAFELFESMQEGGVRPDVISWNTLVSGFARNGDLRAAQHLFDEMRPRGVNSWNCIISGCVQHARLTIDELEECTLNVESLVMREVCLQPLRRRLNVYIGSSLIGMYSECGEFGYARSVFAAIEEKNAIVWNELIRSYINEGRMDEA